MAQEEKITFTRPVYKDQTVGANEGVLAVPGDSIVFSIHNDGAPPTAVTLVLTTVSNAGKTVGWNRDAANSSYRSDDISRVHAKHQYKCRGATNYATATAFNGPATNIVINSITYAFSFPATAPGAQGLQDAINNILQGDGWAAVTLDTVPNPDTLAVSITGTTKKITSISNNGVAVLFV